MADIGKAPEGFPRLMQAARALAGLTIEELAAKLTDEDGLGARSLRDVENGTREHLAPSKRRAILEVCDLPPALLTGDLWWVQTVQDRLDRLADDLLLGYTPDDLIRRAFDALAREHAAGGADLGERIDRLEQIIAVSAGAGISGAVADLSVASPTRGVSEGLKDRLPPVETENESAADSRDEGDAKSESARARREANR